MRPISVKDFYGKGPQKFRLKNHNGQVEEIVCDLWKIINDKDHAVSMLLEAGRFKAFRRFLSKKGIVWTFDIPTAATDGIRLFFNPFFAEKLVAKWTPKAVDIVNKKLSENPDRVITPDAKLYYQNLPFLFVIMHEIYHQVYRHLEQEKRYSECNGKHLLCNCAQDMEINRDIEIHFPNDFAGMTKFAEGQYGADRFPNEYWKQIFDVLDDEGYLPQPQPKQKPPMGQPPQGGQEGEPGENQPPQGGGSQPGEPGGEPWGPPQGGQEGEPGEPGGSGGGSGYPGEPQGNNPQGGSGKDDNQQGNGSGQGSQPGDDQNSNGSGSGNNQGGDDQQQSGNNQQVNGSGQDGQSGDDQNSNGSGSGNNQGGDDQSGNSNGNGESSEDGQDGKSGADNDEPYEVEYGEDFGTDDILDKGKAMDIAEKENKPYDNEEKLKTPEDIAKERVNQSMSELKGVGKNSSSPMARILAHIETIFNRKPVTDWKGQLIKKMNKIGGVDFNKIMDRRKLSTKDLDRYELIKRKEYEDKMGADVFYLVDASGSINDNVLTTVFSQIINIEKKTQGINITKSAFTYFAVGIDRSRIRMWYKDTSAQKIINMIKHDKQAGDVGGGTDIAESLLQVTRLPAKYYTKTNPHTICILFTDAEDWDSSLSKINSLPYSLRKDIIVVIINKQREMTAAVERMVNAGIPGHNIITVPEEAFVF